MQLEVLAGSLQNALQNVNENDGVMKQGPFRCGPVFRGLNETLHVTELISERCVMMTTRMTHRENRLQLSQHIPLSPRQFERLELLATTRIVAVQAHEHVESRLQIYCPLRFHANAIPASRHGPDNLERFEVRLLT